MINVIINNEILINKIFDEYFNHDKKNWLIYYISRKIINIEINKNFVILKMRIFINVYYIFNFVILIFHQIDFILFKNK